VIAQMGARQAAPNELHFGEYKRNRRIIAGLTSVGVHCDHLLSNLHRICVHKALRLIPPQLMIRQGLSDTQIRNQYGITNEKSSSSGHDDDFYVIVF